MTREIFQILKLYGSLYYNTNTKLMHLSIWYTKPALDNCLGCYFYILSINSFKLKSTLNRICKVLILKTMH